MARIVVEEVGKTIHLRSFSMALGFVEASNPWDGLLRLPIHGMIWEDWMVASTVCSLESAQRCLSTLLSGGGTGITTIHKPKWIEDSIKPFNGPRQGPVPPRNGVGAGFLGPGDQTVPSRGEASWGSAEEEEEEG